MQRLRGQIERVDVVDLSTYRVLFTLDEPTLESMRRTPDDAVFEWEPNQRTATLPAWPVALLIYISHDPLPFLGHFFDFGDVYFVDEADPWETAVWEQPANVFRDVYPIPTDWELDDFLTERLGEHDPFGKLAHKAQRIENLQCGRVSQVVGDPFPDLPKAIIEPADVTTDASAESAGADLRDPVVD
jgi:hypothetical protein